jgi:hypothetical protein
LQDVAASEKAENSKRHRSFNSDKTEQNVAPEIYTPSKINSTPKPKEKSKKEREKEEAIKILKEKMLQIKNRHQSPDSNMIHLLLQKLNNGEMQTTENETQLKNSKLLSELELQKERCDSLESMVRRYEMERSLMKTAMDEKSQALKKLLSSNLTVRNY